MDVPGFALITGAASGMGRETAKKFAQDGAAGVSLFDLNESGLQETMKIIEPLAQNKDFKILIHAVDISDESAVTKAVDNTAETFGRLDYVVNAAGIAFKHPGGAAFVETQDWTRVLNTNLNGTFFVLRQALKIMLKQEPIKSSFDGRTLQRGSIVNIASVAGMYGVGQWTAYCASKHAILGLTRQSSEDHACQGIRINAVCPGFVDTPMTRSTPEISKTFQAKLSELTPLGRAGEAAEIADAVIFLCGGRSSFIAGSAMVVDGGYTQR